MGDYALLEPRPGGRFVVDINGVPVRGAYLELDPPRRLVLSWGHAGSDRLPPGSSTVEIRFTPKSGGTLVEVVHRGLPAGRISSTGSPFARPAAIPARTRGPRSWTDRALQPPAVSNAARSLGARGSRCLEAALERGD